MYAVIETGGKQYRVELGTELAVELLDARPGEEITLDRVLLVADGEDAAVGRPLVADASVRAEVLRQDRGEKVISFKYRPKARRRVKKGHRQEQTVLRVTDLLHNGRSAAESARKAEADAMTERQRLEEAAARQAAEDAALAARLAARTETTTEGAATAEAPAPAPRRGRARAIQPEPETAVEAQAESPVEAQPVEAEPQVAAEEPPLTTENPEGAEEPGTPPARRPRSTRKDE